MIQLFKLAELLELKPIVVSDPQRTVEGGYTGDLLSWVMGRAQPNDAWVTIMSNANIVAVASLADVACVVLAEGVQPDPGVAESAQTRGVNIYGSHRPAFELSALIRALI